MNKMTKEILEKIISNGGIPYAVGGWVRDQFMGLKPKDLDIEVHRLSPEELSSILSQFGEVDLVGESFGVYRLHHLDVDWSIPRKDNLTGKGHKGFSVSTDPFMGVHEAAKRRDFTINAMSIDLRDNSLVDPFNGREDLEKRILRVVCPETFVEDPLRVLRGAQFCARLGLTPDADTVSLCKSIKGEYQYLAKDRVREEFKKLLLKGKTPSLGLEFLRQTEWLEHFPELLALEGCEQDPIWHPEGDVWIHTCQVVNNAAEIKSRVEEKDRWAFMLAALCHDLGKPSTKTVSAEGRIQALGHAEEGLPLVESLFHRFSDEADVLPLIKSLVQYHMLPHQWSEEPVGDSSYRRLAKKVDLTLVGLLALADGGSEEFLNRAKDIKVLPAKITVVQGRDLIARGLKPGKEFKEIISRCEEIFLEEGITDPNVLLDRVLN